MSLVHELITKLKYKKIVIYLFAIEDLQGLLFY